MSTGTTLMFMIKKLDDLHHELVVCLKHRIKEHMLLVASPLSYLQNPKIYFEPSKYYSDVFLMPDCNKMRKEIIDLHTLGQTTTKSTTDVCVSTYQDILCRNDGSATVPLNRQVEMVVPWQLQVQDNSSNGTPTDIEPLVKIEMALYENGVSRGKYIESANNNLK